jgi:hypothetical protein
MEYWSNGIMGNIKELRIDEFRDCESKKFLNPLIP